MARRYTSNFGVVGFGDDPTPGDPDGIRALSAQYNNLSSQASQAFALFANGGRIRSGKGDAMKALQERISEVPRMLDQTAVSFSNAAKAYTVYADLLTDAQSKLDTAMDQGLEAQSNGAGKPTVQTAPDATPDQATADAQANNAISAANDQLTAAKRLAQDAHDLRENGSRTASSQLNEAATHAIPARDVFKKIADFLEDNPIVEIVLGILVAIVSVFFPVFGLIAAGLLFGVSLLKMGEEGKFNAGDIVAGVLGIIPGIGALGIVGKFASAVAKFAPIAKLLAGVSKFTGPILEGVTKMANAFRSTFAALGKGIIGTKTGVLLGVFGATLKDVTVGFALGVAGGAMTNAINGKPIDIKNLLITSAISAGIFGALTPFSMSKFGVGLKEGFTNIGTDSKAAKEGFSKAFSKDALLGIKDGKLNPANAFEPGKGGSVKVDSNGIKSTTSPSTEGTPSTTVETPNGVTTKTEVVNPGAAPADGTPGPAIPPTTKTTTTTPDGFTSTTQTDGNGTTNTIEGPKGDQVITDGNGATVNTPDLSTHVSPTNAETTHGDFAVNHTNPVAANDGNPAVPAEVTVTPNGAANPTITVGDHSVATPNVTVTDHGGNHTSVNGGDGVTVHNQGNTNTAQVNNAPVAVHDFSGPNPTVNHNVGDGHGIGFDPANPGNGLNLPGGTHVATNNNGHVVVDHPNQAGTGNHQITLDGNNTTFNHPGGTNTTVQNNGNATVTHTGGATVDVPNGGHGFTVNDGATHLNFNDGGTNPGVTVNPASTTPVHVNPNGHVSSGPVTTHGDGSGTIHQGGSDVATFDNNGTTFHGPNGDVNVGHDGTFNTGGIQKGPDGAVTLTQVDNHNQPAFPKATVNPDGTATFVHNGVDHNVDAAGNITHATPQFKPGPPNPDGTASAPVLVTPKQPAVGAPANFGPTSVHVNPDGTTHVTLNGQNGTTATVGPNGTTLNHPDVTVTTTPGNVVVNGTGGASNVHVNTTTPTGGTGHPTTTVNTGNATPNVSVNHGDNSTTVAGHGGNPPVTVAPTNNGHQIDAGNTKTTINPDGASTDVGNTPVVNTNTGGENPVTTANTGGDTTLTSDNNGSAVSDNGNTFSVDNTGKVTSGPSEINHTTPPGGQPQATVTPSDPTNHQPFTANATNNGVDIHAGGVHTSGSTNNPVTFAHDGPHNTTFNSPGDGTLTSTHTGGDTAAVNTDHSFDVHNAGPNPTDTHSVPSNDATNGPTTTTTIDHGNGNSTTVTSDNNGIANTTTQKSGTTHTVHPDGHVEVVNPKSGTKIDTDGNHTTVETPDKHVIGDKGDVIGGGHTFTTDHSGANGNQAGTTISVPATPFHPTSTTHQHPDGTVDTGFGPVQTSHSPGGVNSVGTNQNHVPGPGDPAVNVTPVTGDGNGQITVQAPGGGPTVSHTTNPHTPDGGGGETTVNAGNVTITKSPEPPAPNPDGTPPATPVAPETFNVQHNNGGPSVDVQVNGKGDSVVHSSGGNFDVKHTGKGGFEVAGGGGANDKVNVAPDGTLTDHNGVPIANDTPPVQPPVAPGAVAPPPPPPTQTHTLADDTVIHNDGAGNVTVTPPNGANPETTIAGGSATTTDGNVTVVQHPDGKATFTTPTDGSANLSIGPKGVEGTHTQVNQDTTTTVFKVDAGNSGGVKVTNTADGHTTKLSPNGSFSEQHSASHDKFAQVDPPSTKDAAFDVGSTLVAGAVNTVAQTAYSIDNGADPHDAIQSAGLGFAHSIPTTLAGSHPSAASFGSSTGSVEGAIASFPRKVIDNEAGVRDSHALNQADPSKDDTTEIKNHDPGAHAPTQ